MNVKALFVCACLTLPIAGNVRADVASHNTHAIASAHPLATEAGFATLAAGGNAFDAAVTIAAVLAVVEPYNSGLGGGGFFLLHRSKDSFDIMLDARETAPGKANATLYLDEQGNVVAERSQEGPLAAGIPGIPAAFEHLAKRYGKLPLQKTLEPAIRYAREGFAVDEAYRRMTEMRIKLLRQYPATASVFLLDAKSPPVGWLLVQTELAQTLEKIAQQGAQGFYSGDIAKSLVKSVQADGGVWELDDLKNYRVIERKPVTGEYNGMKIVSASLPSSGGIVLLNILNMLKNFDEGCRSEAECVHLLTEAMRRGYRERAEYLGDTDFVNVPVEKLLNPFYAAGLAASIRMDRASESAAWPGAPPDAEGDDTTHFSIIDAQGNRVAATLSINFPFGSGYLVADTGVILNNEMDDFAVKPGMPNGYGLIAGANNPNSIEPGKRMLSSMTPTFLQKDDRIAVLGTPGGSRIISMVLLAALKFFEGGSAEQMVELSRFHHQFVPDRIFFEDDAFNRELQLELQLLGHRLTPSHRRYGNMQVVILDKKKNILEAASDSRGDGMAAVRTGKAAK